MHVCAHCKRLEFFFPDKYPSLKLPSVFLVLRLTQKTPGKLKPNLNQQLPCAFKVKSVKVVVGKEGKKEKEHQFSDCEFNSQWRTPSPQPTVSLLQLHTVNSRNQSLPICCKRYVSGSSCFLYPFVTRPQQ